MAAAAAGMGPPDVSLADSAQGIDEASPLSSGRLVEEIFDARLEALFSLVKTQRDWCFAAAKKVADSPILFHPREWIYNLNIVDKIELDDPKYSALKKKFSSFNPSSPSYGWTKELGDDAIALQVKLSGLEAFIQFGVLNGPRFSRLFWMSDPRDLTLEPRLKCCLIKLSAAVRIAKQALQAEIDSRTVLEQRFTIEEVDKRVRALAKHTLSWYEHLYSHLDKLAALEAHTEKEKERIAKYKKTVKVPQAIIKVSDSKVILEEESKSLLNALSKTKQVEKQFAELAEICAYSGFLADDSITFIAQRVEGLIEYRASSPCHFNTLRARNEHPEKRKRT